MEPLTLQLPRGDDETIECWDEDGELQCNEDFQFRAISRATSVTNSSVRRSGHRDSISSRVSARSDLDSNVGGDEDWEVDLHENDESVDQEAIASAKNAGIPLPANVPKSALVGGAIKRLGGRKPKRDFLHDWAEDLELPSHDDALELKSPPVSTFPESIRQVSSEAASPVKARSPVQNDDSSPQWQPPPTKLSGFQDEGDDADWDADFQDVPTIKVAKSRSPTKATPASEPTHKDADKADDVESFDQDFELPADSSPLKLAPKANRKTPSPTPEDFDVDWCEGSIGVRFGGTNRDRPSNTSSSISVISPSISSCLSGASDEDGLDGLVLPDGPLSLDSSLKKREESKTTEASDQPAKLQHTKEQDDLDDFFSGIDIEGGNAFTRKKLSLNPNVKCKSERPSSPARRSATSITFTDSTGSPKTRIPRPSSHAHSHSTSLETVSESGAPPSKFRALQPHTDHSRNLSASSLPRPGPAPTPTRSTFNRRPVGAPATQGVADDHAGRRFLRSKRSMPTIRNSHQVTPTELSQNSPSRQDGTSRSSVSTIRSLAQADRMGNDTRPLNRRSLAPFIPAGAPLTQSQHPTTRGSRPGYRKSSDASSDFFNSQGSVSRTSRLNRNGLFGGNPGERGPGGVLTAAKQSFTKPPRRRNFGDGSELESFDDLPTSSFTESRFVKNPAGRGAPRALRTRLSVSQNTQPRGETSQPQTPVTAVPASKPPESTPRFARDTNASRNAREQRIGSMNAPLRSRESNPLMSINTNLKAPATSRTPSSPTLTRKRKSKSSSFPGSKPHLIKPMGSGVQETKCELPPNSCDLITMVPEN